MRTPTTAPYGTWASPLDAATVASGAVRFGDVQFNGDSLVWLESRPLEGGRSALMQQTADGMIAEITPDGWNARTMVHEYGGAAYLAHGDTTWTINFADQRVHRQDRGDDPTPITPDPDAPRAVRFADPQLTPDGRTLILIRERHTADGVHNELVSIPAVGGEPAVVASGSDFVSSASISPDGTRLVWLSWDHPQMPWDGTHLWEAALQPDGSVQNTRRIAGSDTESLFQPTFAADGTLYVISDRSGYWNLYRVAGDDLQPIHAAAYDFGAPQWSLAARTYAPMADGRLAVTWFDGGLSKLGILDPSTGDLRAIENDLNAIGSIAASPTDADRIAIVAGGSTQPTAVFSLDLASGAVTLVRSGADTPLDAADISSAEPITFETTGGRDAYALFYAPRNQQFSAPDGERPPLVVYSHGGPTGATTAEFDAEIQFWTTRGFAVVDVNYGGSTGYGREYRNRLRGQWGIVDVDDCVNAARSLAAQGRVDGKRLVIRGGSAGGFTTLAALAFHDVFSAGASYYGVADPEMLARDTHKFESRYMDSMIGPYPEALALYHERSPLHHASGFNCPILVLQGLEDAVVPPSQSEAIVAAVAERGIPHAYLAYEGEQHGFRKASTIISALEAELSFYAQVFGFEPAGNIERIAITNL